MSYPKPQWTAADRIAYVMRHTMATEAEAREYLLAEEGNEHDAAALYRWDRMHGPMAECMQARRAYTPVRMKVSGDSYLTVAGITCTFAEMHGTRV